MFNKVFYNIGVDMLILVKLYCNVSLCYYMLNEYEWCYLYGLYGIKLIRKYNIDFNKMEYRYISSLISIKYIKQAKAYMNGIDWDKIKCDKIKKEFKKLNRIINCKLKPDNSDWNTNSNFIGNIEIQYIDASKGRGIIATKDIKKGELILCEKAFSHGNYHKNTDNDSMIQIYNEQTNKVYSGRNQELILDTIKQCFINGDYNLIEKDLNKIFNYKHLPHNIHSKRCQLNRKRLLSLYDGQKIKTDILNINEFKYDVLDHNKNILLIHYMCNQYCNKYIEFNIYETISNYLVDKSFDNKLITSNKINNIILNNAFDSLINPNNIKHFTNNSTNNDINSLKNNEKYCISGLWLLGSMFNHSNNPNTKRIITNKTMIIKAKKDIKPGNEINISYIDNSISYHNKINELKNWGIN